MYVCTYVHMRACMRALISAKMKNDAAAFAKWTRPDEIARNIYIYIYLKKKKNNQIDFIINLIQRALPARSQRKNETCVHRSKETETKVSLEVRSQKFTGDQKKGGVPLARGTITFSNE